MKRVVLFFLFAVMLALPAQVFAVAGKCILGETVPLAGSPYRDIYDCETTAAGALDPIIFTNAGEYIMSMRIDFPASGAPDSVASTLSTAEGVPYPGFPVTSTGDGWVLESGNTPLDLVGGRITFTVTGNSTTFRLTISKMRGK